MKMTKQNVARLALTAVLCLTVAKSYAKFWGSEKTPMGGVSGTPDGSQCFQTYTVTHYVFWIQTSTEIVSEEVPCGPGQGI